MSKMREYAIVLILILIFLLVEFLLFKFIGLFTFNYFLITLLLVLAFHFVFLKKIGTLFIFIGGVKPFVRFIEYQINKGMSNDYEQSITQVYSLLEHLKTNGTVVYGVLYYHSVVSHFFRRMNFELVLLEKIRELNSSNNRNDNTQPLSKYQVELLINLTELKKLVEESRIIEDLQSNSEFEKDSNLDRYINLIQEQLLVINKPFNLLKTLSCWENVLMYFKNNALGSFQHARAEMNILFDSEEFILKSLDRTDISGIIIKQKKDDIIISNDESRLTRSTASTNSNSNLSVYDNVNLRSSGDINSSRNLIETNSSNPPIVIICSGNGGPYELFHKNHYWLNYYLNQNFHVCLWNYRGFGLSTGTPSFKSMKDDSEVVFRYLNESQKYKTILVHGISLGGVPACHLAKNYNLEAIIADRTFSCIEDVIQEFLPLGKIVKLLYQITTLFNCDSDNVKNFYETKCTKILIFDRRDQIIKEKASLLKGVSDAIFEDLTQSEEDFIKLVFGFNSENNDRKSNEEELKIIETLNSLNKLFTSELKEEMRNLNNSYLTLDESYSSTESGMMDELNDSYDEKQLQSDLKDVFNLYPDLNRLFSCKLFSIDSFSIFMKMTYVWGTTSEKNNLHPIIQAAINLNKVCSGLFKLDRKLKNKDFKQMTSNLYHIFTTIKRLYMEIYMPKSGENDLDNYELCRDVYSHGYAVNVRCGHNGVPNNNESLILKRYLDLVKKSN